MTLPASSKSATDRCFSSAIDWNDRCGLERLLLPRPACPGRAKCSTRQAAVDCSDTLRARRKRCCVSSCDPSSRQHIDDRQAGGPDCRSAAAMHWRPPGRPAGRPVRRRRSASPSRDDRDLDLRHLVDAQRAVVVEVRLDDLAALAERDRIEQDRAKAVADAAFHLRRG